MFKFFTILFIFQKTYFFSPNGANAIIITPLIGSGYMKKLIVLIGFAFSFSAQADLETLTCASFARGAAESLYLTEATGIQGHTYDSVVTRYKQNKKEESAEVRVNISGSNDEGDSWDSKYIVLVSIPSCKIIEIDSK